MPGPLHDPRHPNVPAFIPATPDDSGEVVLTLDELAAETKIGELLLREKPKLQEMAMLLASQPTAIHAMSVLRQFDALDLTRIARNRALRYRSKEGTIYDIAEVTTQARIDSWIIRKQGPDPRLGTPTPKHEFLHFVEDFEELREVRALLYKFSSVAAAELVLDRLDAIDLRRLCRRWYLSYNSKQQAIGDISAATPGSRIRSETIRGGHKL